MHFLLQYHNSPSSFKVVFVFIIFINICLTVNIIYIIFINMYLINFSVPGSFISTTD